MYMKMASSYIQPSSVSSAGANVDGILLPLYFLLVKNKKVLPVYIQYTELLILDVREGCFSHQAHFTSLTHSLIHRKLAEFISQDFLGYVYISVSVWMPGLQIYLLFRRQSATSQVCVLP